MDVGTKTTILRLTPLFGILSFLVSFPLQNFRVESVQPNGLPEISYPLGLHALVLQLLGIGLIAFGVLFILSPVPSLGFRRATGSSALVAGGVPLLALSGFVVLANYSEWQGPPCGGTLTYPVCSSILRWITDFVGIGLVGVVLLGLGLYLRFRRSPRLGFEPTYVLGNPPPHQT